MFVLTPNSPVHAVSNQAAMGVSLSSDNVKLRFPSAGSTVVGSHSLTVVSQYSNGYRASLSVAGGGADHTALVSEDVANTHSFAMTTKVASGLDDNTWGYALADDGKFSPLTNNQTEIKAITVPTSSQGDTTAVYYGARVDDLMNLPAGSYNATVTYTVTAELWPPKINFVTPDNYPINGSSGARMTIYGENLYLVDKVVIDLDSDQTISGGDVECTDIQTVSIGEINCKLPASTKSGIYSVIVSNPGGVAKRYRAFQYYDGAHRTHYEEENNIRVDYESGLIPVTYSGSGDVLKADPANVNRTWYDYGQTRWANAVSLAPGKAATYTNAAPGTTIDKADILGYWVYIPRFAYEVMRSDARDKFVSRQNFDIHFESDEDNLRTPLATCNADISTAADMYGDSKNKGNNSFVKAKDYRTECHPLARTYPQNGSGMEAQTTWATHPAFRWSLPNKQRLLSGFWYGKFMMTGTRYQPTILPGKVANANEYIGGYMTEARNIGHPYPDADEGRTYGDDISSSSVATRHHDLATMNSHAGKNSEYSAVMYLAMSKYGVGTNPIAMNGGYADNSVLNDDDNDNATVITGCGPLSDGEKQMADGGRYWPKDAKAASHCWNANAPTVQHNYYTANGVKSSTTGNATGVYDMNSAGGVATLAAYSTSDNEYVKLWNNATVTTPVKTPYIDIFSSSNFGASLKKDWMTSNYTYFYHLDECTWESCGGQALHEVSSSQSINGNGQIWDNSESSMVDSGYQWVVRGGAFSALGVTARQIGPLSINRYDGRYNRAANMRVTLITSSY